MGLTRVLPLVVIWVMVGGLIQPASLGAQGKGPPVEMIKSAYQEILRACDANKDGQLSAQECLGAWKDKAKAEKECKYWDANGDGTITEGEYVDQVRKMMK